jgi:hypothetical protein
MKALFKTFKKPATPANAGRRDKTPHKTGSADD